jgi:hypothetical protein
MDHPDAKFFKEREDRIAQSCGQTLEREVRTPLCERVARQLSESRRHEQKAERLAELSDLLEKHPDFARILDLVEEVRG